MNNPTGHPADPPPDAVPEPDPPVKLDAEAAQTIRRTLGHLDEFLRRHASAAVHAELRAFAAAQGWHPISGSQALLDRIGLHALALGWAIDAATGTDHATITGTDQNKENP